MLSQPSQGALLLSTKLRPQRLPSDFVPRPRVHERLDEGNGRRLTLVCAPAGFGKTIAVAGWLQDVDRPCVWVNLDELDSGLTSFTTLLATALESAVPGVGREALTALARTEHPSPSELSALLADDLAPIEHELIVVLDDYHVIREPSVHVLMSLLLRRLPTSVQLVIASREEPSLPIAALRARRELAEVRAEDLRFSRAEASSFLAGSGRPPLEPQIVAEAVDRTEGWAVGLRMLALGGALAVPDEAGVGPTTSHQLRFADAYLLEEVLAQQPPELQRFLMQTSVLDRFSVPLIEAVVDGLQPGDAQRLLDASMIAGLFVVALDDEQRWYRYHILFRDMLRRCLERELGAERVRALITRASIWLDANGLLEEAAISAFAAGDALRAAALIERLVPIWQQREQWATLDVWLRRLPPDVVAMSPALGLARCRLLTLRCELGALESELRRLETMLTRSRMPPLDPADLDAALGLINASFAYLLHETGGDDWEALGRTHLAFQQLPRDRTDQRGAACLLHAVTLQCLGRTEEALAWLRAELGKDTALPHTIIARLLNAEAYVELSSGQLDAATHTARQLVALARAGDLTLHSGWGHYTLGRIAYEWNDLAGASEHFNAVLALGDGAHSICTVNATCGLALSLAALGKHREAERLVFRELARVEEDGNTFFVVRLRSFMARLAVAASDPDRAAHWSAGVAFTQRAITAFDLEDPWLTRALVLIAQPTDERLAEASSLLERALDAAHSRHIVSSIVKGLALRALVERSRGEASSAFKSITDALTIATPGRFIRTFVDLGPPLTRLLVELAIHGGLPKGGERVLEACRAEAGLRASSLPDRNADLPDDVVSLTWRELDVLHLLDGRHTNREIAQQLCIAEETVKKHAVNIYAKLHVTGRREAVARAYALGLLNEHDLRPPTLA
jgi:LuxR family maltose regulon positive regulatory protein